MENKPQEMRIEVVLDTVLNAQGGKTLLGLAKIKYQEQRHLRDTFLMNFKLNIGDVEQSLLMDAQNYEMFLDEIISYAPVDFLKLYASKLTSFAATSEKAERAAIKEKMKPKLVL